MVEALVGVVATVLAAVLSATVTKYGWSFWRPSKSISCSGSARELLAIRDDGTEVVAGEGTHYDLRDCLLRIRGNRATFTAHLTIVEAGKTLAKGRMTGAGPFQNGYAYLQYHAQDTTRDQSWTGLCLIRAPGLGDLTGYWMTEDNLRAGVVAFGEVRLCRG